jgi:hypothetical protein
MQEQERMTQIVTAIGEAHCLMTAWHDDSFTE